MPSFDLHLPYAPDLDQLPKRQPQFASGSGAPSLKRTYADDSPPSSRPPSRGSNPTDHKRLRTPRKPFNRPSFVTRRAESILLNQRAADASVCVQWGDRAEADEGAIVG